MRRYMSSVYNKMAGGLILSGLVASAISYTDLRDSFFHIVNHHLVPTTLGTIGMFLPLIMIVFMSLANFSRNSWSVSSMRIFYWLFTFFQGIGLSTALMAYRGTDIVSCFFITAGAFASLSFWGYTTNRNLSGLGSFCVMGLFGLVLMSIIGMFTGFALSQVAFSIVGLIVFSGLTAWETQSMKSLYLAGMADSSSSYFNAISLYLNFINIFLMILNLKSSSRN